VSRVDDVFAALANPTRRALLGLLLDRSPQPMQQLASNFPMRRPSVSEHLKVLRDAGLVSRRKTGRQWHYQLEPEQFAQMQEWLSPYEQFWRQRPACRPDLPDAPAPGEPADRAR
jgi:DNA-binding transcriptional ArsR family regulator